MILFSESCMKTHHVVFTFLLLLSNSWYLNIWALGSQVSLGLRICTCPCWSLWNIGHQMSFYLLSLEWNPSRKRSKAVSASLQWHICLSIVASSSLISSLWWLRILTFWLIQLEMSFSCICKVIVTDSEPDMNLLSKTVTSCMSLYIHFTLFSCRNSNWTDVPSSSLKINIILHSISVCLCNVERDILILEWPTQGGSQKCQLIEEGVK